MKTKYKTLQWLIYLESLYKNSFKIDLWKNIYLIKKMFLLASYFPINRGYCKGIKPILL